MSKYIVHFKANPAVWPNDPKELVAIWESVFAGTAQLLEHGPVEQIGWVSNTEGYALLEVGSKAEAFQIVTGFYPLFSQDIMEFTPNTDAGKAIVAGAKMVADSAG